MSLEFVDDIARGSRWWDAVGRYDDHADVDVDDVVKRRSSHVEHGAPYGEAPEGLHRSDMTVIDGVNPQARSSEQTSSEGMNEVPPAIWLEDALTNECSSPFIDE